MNIDWDNVKPAGGGINYLRASPEMLKRVQATWGCRGCRYSTGIGGDEPLDCQMARRKFSQDGMRCFSRKAIYKEVQ